METNKILEASLLDIVFDGRNKEYGAYQLRKTYNRRLTEAIAGMAVVTGLLFVINSLPHRDSVVHKEIFYVKDVQLEEVKEKKNQLPPPPPPPKTETPKVQLTKFTPPRIVKDNEVKEDDKPPEQEQLQDTKIGSINQEGIKDDGLIAPPASDGGKGIIEGPGHATSEDYDRTFTKVEIESEYPGGAAAWLRYLNKNFRYPQDGLNNEIQGAVVVQFIVDKDGNVSEVQAVSGPEQGGLREEAIRVIAKSGSWTPAIQNGRKVRSYKKQPVIFKLMGQ